MKNDTVTALAASMGLSKATVSRTLNHCGGVDTETRERILAAVNTNEKHECAIYSILPDTPGYFWQEMRHGLSDGEDKRYPMKCNVYSRLRDNFSVHAYLRESSCAHVLLIAASLTPTIRDMLTSFATERFVLLLSEDDGIITNGFYIGSDAESDGYAMAEVYKRRLRDYIPFLLTISAGENRNVDQRTSGFLRCLSESGLPAPYRVEIPSEFFTQSKTFHARMASLLTQVLSSRNLPNDKPFAFYTTFGCINLPLAIEKVRFSDGRRLSASYTILGHDVPLVNGTLPNGVFAACNQDVYAEGLRAMEAANHYLIYREYPEQKRIYIPSIITER